MKFDYDISKSIPGVFSRKYISGKGLIVMSIPVLENFGWEYFEKVFLHEIAHALNTAKNMPQKPHDNNFHKLCIQLGGVVQISQINNLQGDEKQKQIEYNSNCLRTNNAKYKYTCPKCKLELLYFKRISQKVIKRNWCRTCGTKVKDFIFEEIK